MIKRSTSITKIIKGLFDTLESLVSEHFTNEGALVSDETILLKLHAVIYSAIRFLAVPKSRLSADTRSLLWKTFRHLKTKTSDAPVTLTDSEVSAMKTLLSQGEMFLNIPNPTLSNGGFHSIPSVFDTSLLYNEPSVTPSIVPSWAPTELSSIPWPSVKNPEKLRPLVEKTFYLFRDTSMVVIDGKDVQAVHRVFCSLSRILSLPSESTPQFLLDAFRKAKDHVETKSQGPLIFHMIQANAVRVFLNKGLSSFRATIDEIQTSALELQSLGGLSPLIESTPFPNLLGSQPAAALSPEMLHAGKLAVTPAKRLNEDIIVSDSRQSDGSITKKIKTSHAEFLEPVKPLQLIQSSENKRSHVQHTKPSAALSAQPQSIFNTSPSSANLPILDFKSISKPPSPSKAANEAAQDETPTNRYEGIIERTIRLSLRAETLKSKTPLVGMHALPLLPSSQRKLPSFPQTRVSRPSSAQSPPKPIMALSSDTPLFDFTSFDDTKELPPSLEIGQKSAQEIQKTPFNLQEGVIERLIEEQTQILTTLPTKSLPGDTLDVSKNYTPSSKIQRPTALPVERSPGRTIDANKSYTPSAATQEPLFPPVEESHTNILGGKPRFTPSVGVQDRSSSYSTKPVPNVALWEDGEMNRVIKMEDLVAKRVSYKNLSLNLRSQLSNSHTKLHGEGSGLADTLRFKEEEKSVNGVLQERLALQDEVLSNKEAELLSTVEEASEVVNDNARLAGQLEIKHNQLSTKETEFSRLLQKTDLMRVTIQGTVEKLVDLNVKWPDDIKPYQEAQREAEQAVKGKEELLATAKAELDSVKSLLTKFKKDGKDLFEKKRQKPYEMRQDREANRVELASAVADRTHAEGKVAGLEAERAALQPELDGVRAETETLRTENSRLLAMRTNPQAEHDRVEKAVRDAIAATEAEYETRFAELESNRDVALLWARNADEQIRQYSRESLQQKEKIRSLESRLLVNLDRVDDYDDDNTTTCGDAAAPENGPAINNKPPRLSTAPPRQNNDHSGLRPRGPEEENTPRPAKSARPIDSTNSIVLASTNVSTASTVPNVSTVSKTTELPTVETPPNLSEVSTVSTVSTMSVVSKPPSVEAILNVSSPPTVRLLPRVSTRSPRSDREWVVS